MADNVLINDVTVAGGQTIATDEILGIQHELVKIEFGVDGAATMVSASNPLPTTEVAPTTIFNGKTVVTTAGTQVALASSQVVKSVTIKALSTNTGIVYVGNSSVDSTTGFQLSAYESVSMDIANLATVFVDSSIDAQGVTYIAVN